MNVLISAAGRRGYLVRWFREAVGPGGTVVATNSHDRSPAFAEADVSHVVPAAGDPDFMPTLVRTCVKHRIDLLFSLHDWEAPAIARGRGALEEVGVRCVMPTTPILETCLDKWRLHGWAQSNGIPVPATVLGHAAAARALSAGELGFPLVVKPRRGQGSVGVQVVHSIAELNAASTLVVAEAARNGHLHRPGTASAHDPVLIVQEYLPGAEFGVDVINDLDGRPAATLVKEKLAMRAGETDAAITRDVPSVARLARGVGAALGHPGLADVDVRMDHEGTPHLVEVNPRFGGGYPFSHAAGARIPHALVAWAGGATPEPAWLRVRPGVVGYKQTEVVAPSDGD